MLTLGSCHDGLRFVLAGDSQLCSPVLIKKRDLLWPVFLPRKHPTPPSKLWIREVFGVLESGLLLQEEGQVDVLRFNRVKVSQSHRHI